MTINRRREAFRGSTALTGVFSLTAEGDSEADLRNLVGEAIKKFDAQNKAWDEYKKTNDADITAKLKDVVTAEKLARINAEIEKNGKELDQINASIAALRVNGGTTVSGGAPVASTTAEQKAYRSAFSGAGGYLRRGADANLGDLSVKASLSSDSNPDGGYTVTPEIDTTISRVQANVCSMRRVSQVITISTMTHRKMVSLGGAGYGWVGERDLRPQTNTPTLSPLDFPSKELYAMPAATQTLLDDSAVNIESWLGDEVGITFGEQEGSAFVSGDGVNAPQGFLTVPNVADASYAWGKLGYTASGNSTGFAASNPGDALITLAYSLKQGYRVNANWMCNRVTQGLIRQFKDQQNNYLWQPGFTAGQPATILGYPVIDDDNMPNLGSGTLPVAFGDFKRGYLIVDRMGTRVLRDPYSSKPYVLFYTTKRVGGGVQNFEAIKLLKCA